MLEGLKQELRSLALIREYVATYEAERKQLARAETAAKAEHEQRLGEVRRLIRRLVDAIGDGSAPALSVRDRLAELEGEKAGLEAEPAPAETAVALHPAAVERYLGQVESLAAELETQGTNRARHPRQRSSPTWSRR